MITATMTVNQILTRVAVESGLDAATDPFASTEKEYIQLSSLLQVACEDLALAYPWEFLVKELEITTVDSQNAYPLPDDYLSLVSDTGWDLTSDTPVIPLSPQKWRAMEAGDIDPVETGFRIVGREIQLTPLDMTSGKQIKFEYICNSIAVTQAVPPEYIPTLGSGSDIVLFDRTLITRYLKVLWFEAKGFDTTAAQQSFNQIFDMVTSNNSGSTILKASGATGGFRMLDNCNAPDHGYGL